MCFRLTETARRGAWAWWCYGVLAPCYSLIESNCSGIFITSLYVDISSLKLQTSHTSTCRDAQKFRSQVERVGTVADAEARSPESVQWLWRAAHEGRVSPSLILCSICAAFLARELNHLAFHTFAGRIRQARWWCRGVGAAALLVLCQRVRCRSPHFAEEGGRQRCWPAARR